jgi:LPXTG-site transpeptidase (sortase) family protein
MRLRLIIQPLAARTVARDCFLALGVICLGICGGDFLQRVFYQAYESRVFDRTMGDRTMSAPDANDSFLPEPPPASTVAGNQAQGRPTGKTAQRSSHRAAKAVPASAIIGRLSVRRLNLSAMVREGVDAHTLQLAVGHIPSTALPGQTGNVAVAGHRDTFFRGLKDLKTKDEILFTTLDGEFRYVVESLIVVEPDNVAVLAASAGNVLTLVTCYPFSYMGNAPKRFIVRARQVLPPALEPRSSVE